MKLNCDMGESFGPWTMGCDARVMPLVDMANIACGFHASDPLNMARTVELALASGVLIGAHPGYPDLVGFGRRSLACSVDEAACLVQYQVGALQAIAGARGARVSYIKPHGALYNDMMKDDALMFGLMKAARSIDEGLPLMILATVRNDHYRDMASAVGIGLLFEAFADRAYDREGQLLSRSRPGAVLTDPAAIVEQAKRLSAEGVVQTVEGSVLALAPDTLCVHGDNDASIAVVQQIRQALSGAAR
jgi:5-oxoprolinase (ATP-hydrolysing) subunit A